MKTDGLRHRGALVTVNFLFPPRDNLFHCHARVPEEKNKEKDILLPRRLEPLKLEKMNGQNRSVNNIIHPRYLEEVKYCGPIEWEETSYEIGNKVIEPGKDEEGANSDDFICNSTDKDYEIRTTLVSLSIILKNLEMDLKTVVTDVERIKERCEKLGKLTNHQMSDL